MDGAERKKALWEPMIDAIQAGEPDAVDLWYRSEHPRVWKLCFGILADRAEADDLAQEAMVRLLDHLGGRDMSKSYSAWRNRVVTNLCRDRLRRNQTRRKAEGQLPCPPTASRAPDDALDQQELRDWLVAALRRLSDREREVFVLRDLEGHSTTAVAELLGVREASVRSQLSLARSRLRGLFDKVLKS